MTLAAAILIYLLVCGPVGATETKQWIVDTAEDLLQGQGQGVGVSSDGRLVQVPSWRKVLALDEPIAIAAALDHDGALVLGTGHPARLWRIGDGRAEQLAELEQEQITAVLPRADGSILVAAVSPGVLLRWKDGALDEVGRLGSGGIWDLVAIGGADGDVVAAAGPPATLYRVGEQGLERWVELPDAYARCLAASQSDVIVGTSGKGLLARVTADGQVVLLADSPFTEISDLVIAADGSIWAAALVGEPVKVSSAPTAAGDASGSSAAGASAGSGGASTETGSLSLDLPKVGGSSATSEVLRLTREGALLKVHRFTKQVASTMAVDGEAVLVGTGFEGELWRFTPEGGARLATLDAVQVVATAGDGEYLVTQGPAQVLRRDSTTWSRATYRSAAERFALPVRLGRFQIDPPVPGVKIRFRTGVTSKPDTTWMPWSGWLEGAVGQVPVPSARVLQWELELPQGSSHALERVGVAYREVNLAPRIESVTVADPGVVYLNGTPPSGPVIDAQHPDVSGIFTVIDPDEKRSKDSASGKKYWRVGYRTVSWKAEDPNGDAVRFKVELESRDGLVLPVRDGLEATQLALDTTAVPDGLYRFQVTADDHVQNPAEGAGAKAVSEWFVVDNTPPSVELERQGMRWVVTVRDASSTISRAEWSRDGERWSALAAQDGMMDEAEEHLSFGAVSGAHLIAVRVIDQHHNRATVGAREE